MKFYAYSTVVAVALMVTFGALKDAHGKLVFEDEIKAEKKAPTHTVQNTQPVVEESNMDSEPNLDSRLDRESDAAVEAAPTIAQEPSVQDIQSVDVAPSLINGQGPAVEQSKKVSKSEALRRHRVREELKNEDLLQQKLEELRLRDEMKRTQQINLSGVEKETPKPAPAAQETLPEQRVGSAATEQPVVKPSAPAVVPAAIGPTSQLDGKSSTDMSAVKEESTEWVNRVTINPRGGLSNVTNSNFDIQSRYAVGAAIGVDFTEHFSFEGSYTFSKYDLGAGSAIANPYTYSLQKLQFNDNVFDIGGKAYILDTKSRVRPFVGTGVSYRRGYVNYDERTLSILRNVGANTSDVQISSFSGYIETGLDFQITKNIAFTAAFKYFNVFSSSQSNPIDPNAFVNPYGATGGYGYGYGSAYGVGYADPRTSAGQSLAANNFYQILGGMAVSF